MEHIQFGSKKIDFRLSFVERKTLGITITPDMEVIVKAPVGTPMLKIKETVRKNNGGKYHRYHNYKKTNK